MVLGAFLTLITLASYQNAAPQNKSQPQGASKGASETPVQVYIRGNGRTFTPREVVDSAKALARKRSPSFSFDNSESIVSVSVRQTNRLALVAFSQGVGRPMITMSMRDDGTFADYNEGTAIDGLSIDLK